MATSRISESSKFSTMSPSEPLDRHVLRRAASMSMKLPSPGMISVSSLACSAAISVSPNISAAESAIVVSTDGASGAEATVNGASPASTSWSCVAQPPRKHRAAIAATQFVIFLYMPDLLWFVHALARARSALFTPGGAAKTNESLSYPASNGVRIHARTYSRCGYAPILHGG